MKNNSTRLKDLIAVEAFEMRLSDVFSIYLLKEEEKKNKITNQILKFRIKNYICRRWTMAGFNTKFRKTDSVFIGLF